MMSIPSFMAKCVEVTLEDIQIYAWFHSEPDWDSQWLIMVKFFRVRQDPRWSAFGINHIMVVSLKIMLQKEVSTILGNW